MALVNDGKTWINNSVAHLRLHSLNLEKLDNEEQFLDNMYSYIKQNLQISGAKKFLRILLLGTNCPTEKLSPGLDKLPTKV